MLHDKIKFKEPRKTKTNCTSKVASLNALLSLRKVEGVEHTAYFVQEQEEGLVESEGACGRMSPAEPVKVRARGL